jgi:hypothetical protein
MIRKILEAISDFIDDVLSPQPQPRPIPVRVRNDRPPHRRGEPR